MDGDPFARIIDALSGDTSDNPLQMRFGTVVSRDPMSVKVADLTQKKDALRLDKRLKDMVEFEISHGISKTLMPGSRVLLLTQDDQIFYIVCEVVSA